MPEWLKGLDPGRVIKWITLAGMIGSGIYFAWSVPERLGEIEAALIDGARADSAANRIHLELMYTDCELQGVPIRDCLR